MPHRLEEGYGLNVEALRQIARSGAKVVVTVDCGIASLEEADEARRLGLELIITDHHEFKDRLPDAAVVVHPRRPGGGYPFPHLSGSAVAFKLAWALSPARLRQRASPERFKEFLLDGVMLAALGTVADVVALHDENRIFVRHGLNRLHQTPSPGLKALIAASGLAERSNLKAVDVGFKLGPRLNAVGRLGCARLVVELLTTPSEQRATDLALSRGPKQETPGDRGHILSEARDQVGVDPNGLPALVLASSEWHAGVIGIVAGRLAEQYGRPTLLIALAPRARPSARGPVGPFPGSRCTKRWRPAMNTCSVTAATMLRLAFASDQSASTPFGNVSAPSPLSTSPRGRRPRN